MRGASAIGHFLEKHPDPKLRVLVVWEPILPTDWNSPSTSSLARIADARAKQFWDPNHVVAQKLGRKLSDNPQQTPPTCCRAGNDFYWDDAVLYPSAVHWNDARTSTFWNGPVVKVMPALDTALRDIR